MECTWREEIEVEMADYEENFGDVVSIAPEGIDLDRKFDSDYGGERGSTFTVWTKERVYFPACYDGAEWVASVSRNPNGKGTKHIGGG